MAQVSDWICDMTDDWTLSVWQTPDSYCVWQFRTSPSLRRSIITVFTLHVDGRRKGRGKKKNIHHYVSTPLISTKTLRQSAVPNLFLRRRSREASTVSQGSSADGILPQSVPCEMWRRFKKVKEYHQGQRDGSRPVSIATPPLILFRFPHCASWWVLRTSVRRPPKSK